MSNLPLALHMQLYALFALQFDFVCPEALMHPGARKVADILALLCQWPLAYAYP